MITLARLVSGLALAGTLLPPVMLMTGRIDLPTVKWWMLVSAVAWFAATPVWMDRKGQG